MFSRRERPNCRFGPVAFAAVAMIATLSLAPSAWAQEGHNSAIDRATVMVKFDRSSPERGHRPVDTPWRAVPVLPGESVGKAIGRLSANSLVIDLSPNYLYTQLGASPDDPFFPVQWHLPEIGAPPTWDSSTGIGVTVAVVDGGVSNEGADLSCRSFVAPFASPTGEIGPNAAEPNPTDSHGTHAAGVIAQCTNNGIGAAGVAPEASIMPIRVADADGSITSEYLAEGIIWAIERGADIINLSIGISGGCTTDWPACGDAVVDDAITQADNAGVILVAAAGNDNRDHVSYPANHPAVIAVGATTESRDRAAYSDYGSALSIMAPGDLIYQESFTNADDQSTWGVVSASGTSFAAPQVAGVASLVMSANPSLAAHEVTSILNGTALDLGLPGWDSTFGSGLVQADGAVAAALASGVITDASTIFGGSAVVSESVAIEIAALVGSSPARLSGVDRYGTSTIISQAGFPDGAAIVYIATGLDFPDALSIGPAAATTGGPILLVTRDSIPSIVADELARLNPTGIVVVGGPNAISDTVLIDISSYAPEGSTQRIAGDTRYDTAVEVSKLAFAPGIDTVYVATGERFPDPLAAGAAAAIAPAPVLLTLPDRLHPATRDEILRLGPSQVILVGGPLAVSDSVAAEIMSLGPAVHRVAGDDRYQTAAAVASLTFPTAPAPTFISVGTDFPDAMTGAPLAASRGGPILLTRTDRLPESSASEISRLANDQP